MKIPDGFPMKMPRGIFITYVCDGVGSSAVNMKTAHAVFMCCMLVALWHHVRFIGSRQADFHRGFPEST